MVRVTLVVVTVAVALLAGCTQLGVPSPTPPAMAALEVTGTWHRCHQLGACKYTVELATPGGLETVELVRLHAGAEEGGLLPEAGLPPKLAAGAYRITIVSTMYGDTIEPNGEQTVLGEEARCEADFAVDAATLRVTATVALVPGTCSVTIAMEDTNG